MLSFKERMEQFHSMALAAWGPVSNSFMRSLSSSWRQAQKKLS